MTIKRCIILLLVILLVTTTPSFSNTFQKINSDSIVSITSEQLKETNLIFAEHEKLLIENVLLFKQLENYKLDNSLLCRSDSIKSVQIENYKVMFSSCNSRLLQLEKENKSKSKKVLRWKIGGVTLSVGFLLLLIFK